MADFTAIQVSDTHLSRLRPHFQHNWEVTLAEIENRRPDLVIITGDLSLNGPEEPDDLRFVAEQLARISVPWKAIPGNHDVGNTPPTDTARQPITQARLDFYRDVMGPDWWVVDHEDWRLIGLNTQVMQSGLAAEAEQNRFLEESLATADGRPIAVFIHIPPYVAAPDEEKPSGSALPLAARRALLDRLTEADVRMLACGHVHQDRRRMLGAMQVVWCPSSAFVFTAPPAMIHDGDPVVGFLEHRFTADGVSSQRIEPALAINHDVRNWLNAGGGYYTIAAAPPVFPMA